MRGAVPAFRLEAAGRDVTALFRDRLLSMTITDHKGGTADTLEIVLDDRARRLPFPPDKVELRVWLGYQPPGARPAYMGRFKVDEVKVGSGPRSMTIRAKAADLAGGIREPRTRSWHGRTLGEIVGEVAQGNGLGATVAPGLARVPIPHVDQTEESDAAFLSRLARQNGATMKAGDGAILIVPQAGGQTATGEAAPSYTIEHADGVTWSATFSDRGKFAGTETYWIDPATGEETAVRVGAQGEDAEVYRDSRVYGSKAEAERAAQARQQQGAAGKVKIEVTVPGNPALFSGCSITLAGFRNEVDGAYTPQEVEHTLTSQGYATRVSAEVGGEDKAEAEDDGSDGT